MIGGGSVNTIQAFADYSTIGGGYDNTIQPNAGDSTIGGGYANTIQPNAYLSTIGGGEANTIQTNAPFSTIGGGYGNTIQSNASLSMIGGGDANTIQTNAPYSTIGGGGLNTIESNASLSMIGGGLDNTIQPNAYESTIGGGGLNTIETGAYRSTIGGGYDNIISGIYATVPGGDRNVASTSSFAAGHRAKANHTGSFVWADSLDVDVTDSLDNQFVVRCTGGSTFITGMDGNGFVTSAAILASGSGTWSAYSDRNAKENFRPVTSREILERVAELPISTWNYKSQDKSIRHLGPMAQDFYAAFQVGEDDKHITTVDADGVALAAIQGLNEKVEGRSQKAEVRMEKLEAENAELKQSVAELKVLLGKLAVEKNGDAR